MRLYTTGHKTRETARKVGAVLVFAGVLLTSAQAGSAASLLDMIRSGNKAGFKALLEKGGNPNEKDAQGTPLLMNAALYGDVEYVKMLLDRGADPNAKNGAGATALIWVAGDSEKARLLIAHGADVNVRSALGRTPLLSAAGQDGAGQIVKMLLAKGADVNVQDNLQGQPGIPSGGGKPFPVIEAAKARDGQALRMLIAKGVNVNVRDNNGGTALTEAAVQGNVENVQMLLKAGADVRVTVSLAKFTPLLLATIRNDARIVRMLLDAESDVNAEDAFGSTPAMWAAYNEHGNPEIVKMLADAGADLKHKNSRGETALTWASWNGETQTVAYLRQVTGVVPEPAKSGAVDNQASMAGVREAIAKALPVVQQSGPIFAKKSPCVSCHHQAVPAVALGMAREHGVSVNESLAEQNRQAVLAMIKPATEVLLEGSDVVPQIVGTGSYLLMGLAAEHYPSDDTTTAAVHAIAMRQRFDGSFTGWAPRPPISGGDIRETALAIRAMDLYAPKGRRVEFEARIERARQWLLQAKAATPEERIARLNGLAWGRAKDADLHAAAKEVLGEQRADGGWAQLTSRDSDAYATGEALIALHRSGSLKTSDPAFQRGVKYLLRTQGGDGTWKVKTRAYPFQPLLESGFPHGRDQWISITGTSWAVMALLETEEAVKAVATASN